MSHFNVPEGVVARLQTRALTTPDTLVYRFLEEGEPDGPTTERRCADLHRRALRVAAALREVTEPGDRALLLFPPGLDFIDAFLGCLYAGVVAVPAYPPDPVRLERTLPRLVAIAESAAVAVVLTQELVAGFKEAISDLPPVLSLCPWIAVDTLSEDDGRAPVDPRADDLAFLQYTSGSTGDPKGVMVSHGNLVANIRMIRKVMDARPGDVGVTWLPLFHDMGLIGTTLAALAGENPVHMLSPLHFLKRPMSWLRTLSATGAAISGGPNFAYGLCARRARPEDLEGLDLSRWRLAFNGAEPVDPAVLDRFAQVFAPAGFQARAFFPTYGLAEATLLVTGGPAALGPRVGRFSPGLLEHGLADAHPEGRAAVGCGEVPEGEAVVVADGRLLADRHVGEVWVSGAHVAQGYWGDAQATAATFGHRVPGREGAFMRTGDLGFFSEGQLFLTGRLKDLIIVHGRNIHPHDVERAADRVAPQGRPGSFAAFGVPRAGGEGSEGVGLLVETELRGEALDALVAAVRGAVSEALGIVPQAVVPVPLRGLPKTSSGKLMRGACRQLYLERAPRPAPPPAPVPRPAEAGDALALVRDALARIGGLDSERLAPGVSLAELGLDSVKVAELASHLEDRVGRRVDLTGLDTATLAEIAQRVGGHAVGGGEDVDWRARDISHFQSNTGHDLFEIHRHFGRWSRHARPAGYALYDNALTTAPTPRVALDDEAACPEGLINLASYNYLGLSTRPEVADAAAQALRRYGLSASGSPMLSGLLTVHKELEEELAAFKGVEAALLFPTGYATNVGALSALVGPGDVVVADALVHASIVDGVALARAHMVYFRHNDLKALERALSRARGRVLVAVEGVYSMDGDLPPLQEIVPLCRQHHARLLVDEAHSAFVFGAHGRGVVEHLGVEDGVDIHVGTLSKSLGGMGGYVAGSRELIDYVRTYARARTFSCALAPPVAGGLLAALRLVRQEPELRARLWRNVEIMRDALARERVDTGQSQSQVIPVLVHDDERIFAITRDLLKRGVYLNPVRFPAVKKNHARFRISVSAAHTAEELTRGAAIIGDVLRSHGVIT